MNLKVGIIARIFVNLQDIILGIIFVMLDVRRFLLIMIAMMISLLINASPYTVVIDAGHGGKDVGALGRKVREKDVNLSVALTLGGLIKSEFEDVEVVYTRDKDKYLTLQERAQIANKSKGNLFISIHCNSLDKRNKNRNKIRGASTYVLGLHKSDDNLEVAMRENSVIALEDDYKITYQGFDPNSSESYIIFEISQSAHLAQSVDFASSVQNELNKTANRVDRGVRQAGFLVLARTTMPAVLIELDFICNPTEELFIGSKNGQEKLAKAIFNAFKKYKNSIDNKTISAESITANNKKVDLTEVKSTQQYDDVNDDVSVNQLKYKVQFMTSSERIKSGDKRFKKLNGVECYKENGVYKYTVGNESTEEDAEKLLKEVRKKFKKAFVVVFDGDKRIK